MFAKANEFLKDVKLEASKVTWPTRKELRGATVVVVVTVTIISIFTAVVDRIVVQAVTLVI